MNIKKNEAIRALSLRYLLIKLWHHLSKSRRRQFLLLVILMVISAFAEIATLGAVIPFLGILIDPERFFDFSFVGSMAQDLGITSAEQLLLPFTLVFIGFAVMAGMVRIFLTWANTRVAFATGADLGIEVYRRTLYQPYYIHASQNSSEVISGITIKANLVVFEVLVPLLTIFSATLIAVAIMVTLIIADPVVATVAGIGFGLCYALVTWVSRIKLRRNSNRVAYEQNQVIKALQEGLGGIRDVLLDGVQEVYCNVFRHSDQTLRRAQASTLFISLSPRYAMEAFGVAVIATLAYILSQQVGGISSAIPVLGLLALGAQRLLPCMQQIYYSWASIVGSQASLADTLLLLDQPLPERELQSKIEPLSFQDQVCLKDVRFRYNTKSPWVLNGLNLEIKKGTRVGIVGGTGSGKSTTLDLLMGLLIPTEGKLLIDGETISDKRLRSWQRSIAHVPQDIYLADTTFAENIAFGVPLDDIDIKRVKQVACKAQIADYIESSPEGYKTKVGERGISLSGGQRQRIGIARALYKQASVLVFDEATSALDNITEHSVMDAIRMLESDLTIVLIAHRLTTVQDCDVILEVEDGKVIAQGTYEQLVKHRPNFRNMAKAF